jgi:peptidoglycan/LPS O-acetylase OafA/YrhL
MNRSFSVYLDVVRFTAAFLVYLYHSNQRFLSEAILPASHYGHSSVIVFFVLSGFVIAFVTDTKEFRLPAYAASRISRVYSVTVPAIVLTVSSMPSVANWCRKSIPAIPSTSSSRASAAASCCSTRCGSSPLPVSPMFPTGRSASSSGTT